jgi:putative aldouronate transport system substrate-binding protein
MDRGTTQHPPSNPALTRRGFLSGAAAAAGAAATAPLLAACGNSGSGGTGVTSQSQLTKILPAYIPSTPVKPDIPSVNGSDPGFLSYPATLTRTVTETPGRGGSYTAITPLWTSIPPAGNQYYRAVQKALGADLAVNPSNGNTYGNALPTLFAGDKLPDWICIPSWNQPNVSNFGSQVAASFADLTPYLSGDSIKKYPNLAALPTGAWQAGVWNNRIYGIPLFPGTNEFAGTLFYRADILSKMGITPSVKTAQDLFDLGKEVNDPKHNRWAFDDPLSYLIQMFNVPLNPPFWTQDSKGNLLAAWETPQVIEMLNWEASIVKAGMMHPQAIALNQSNGKQRFYSGQVVITGDGMGAWTGYDAVSGKAANPSYQRMAFPLFSADGSTPRIAIGNNASLFSYLKKSLTKSQIEECLRLANYIAAPFGSYEYTLINFGVQGADWTSSSNGPVLTKAGQTNVAQTYAFLATPVNVQSVQQGYSDVVKAYCAWDQQAGKYVYKPLFWNMNVTVPPSLGTALSAATFTAQPGNILQEVVRGKSSIADFRDAVKSWQRNGGNQLRKFFDNVRSKYGDA